MTDPRLCTTFFERFQILQTGFCQRIAAAENEHLDLGLEYHAFPLQLRLVVGTPQSNCASAFAICSDSPPPNCITHLNNLRELRTITDPQREHFDLSHGEDALRAGDEILDALETQLKALRACVDTMHRQLSDMLEQNIHFPEGGEYLLAMRPEHGVEKYELYRKWATSLPRTREWLRDGSVRSEAEALLLTSYAGEPAALLRSNNGGVKSSSPGKK